MATALVKLLLRVAVFLATVYVFVLPSWRIIEMIFARNAYPDPPTFFPVLVRTADIEGKFAISRLGNLTPESKLVTEVSDQDLAKINRDLGSRIGVKDSTYSYFKIIRRTEQSVEVSLEVPTTSDFYPKGWYRMQNKSIYPQRFIYCGPITGVFIAILPCLMGALGVRGSNKLMQWVQTRLLSRDQGSRSSAQAAG